MGSSRFLGRSRLGFPSLAQVTEMQTAQLKKLRRLGAMMTYAASAADIEQWARDIAAIVAELDLSTANSSAVVAPTVVASETLALLDGQHRSIRLAEPLCGCGRPIHHFGRCHVRRGIAKPIPKSPRPPRGRPPGWRKKDGLGSKQVRRPIAETAPIAEPQARVVATRSEPTPTPSTAASVAQRVANDKPARVSRETSRPLGRPRKYPPPPATGEPTRTESISAAEVAEFIARRGGVTQCPSPLQCGELVFNRETRRWRREPT